jgi:hypothetical protein
MCPYPRAKALGKGRCPFRTWRGENPQVNWNLSLDIGKFYFVIQLVF